jgi:hypothetical protein
MTIWSEWGERNREHLVAALRPVRRALERHASRNVSTNTPRLWFPGCALQEPSRADLEPPSALDALCKVFGLTPFERDALLLCLGVELEPDWSHLVGRAGGDERPMLPTFGLALAALPGAHWSALAPSGPLRYWNLVLFEAGASLTTAPLRIDEPLVHFLTGTPASDARLYPYVRAVPVPPTLSRSQAQQAVQIAELWISVPAAEAPLLNLAGRCLSDVAAIAAAACAELRLRLFAMRGRDVPRAPVEQDWLARIWQREACLHRVALLVETDHADFDSAAGLIARISGHILVAGTAGEVADRPAIRININAPTVGEREAMWRDALGSEAASLDGALRRTAAEFDLTPQEVRIAARTVRSVGEATLELRIWRAAQSASRARLESLAERIDPRAEWHDLVLPRPQIETLRTIAAHVRHRDLATGEWGFAEKCARGLGTSCVFAGPSGTGKSMAAEVLARELNLELYRIDLSQVVSKYIGETEKNLKRVFDAAEAGGVILLFDEADALFGRRSEVRDSHDRYANIEVSYLLQRVDAFRGLAVLTTNLKSTLDPAFLRRVRFVVEFPFPDAAQRSEIWRRVFPPGVPVSGLDFARLGRLSVTGANIRNIAMTAAVISAERQQAVAMSHLLRAARIECAKLEKGVSDAEVAGWC